MKKAFISILTKALVLLLAAGFTSAYAASAAPNGEGDFEWISNDEVTEITITRYLGKRTDVVIPSSIQGIPVVHIADHAFDWFHWENQYNYDGGIPRNEGITSIKSVVIPDTVETIGAYAFAGDYIPRKGKEDDGPHLHSLTSVELPEGVAIGDHAFYCNFALKEVTLYEGTQLGKGSFAGCVELKKVVLPEGLVVIPSECFDSCESLTEIDFPSSLRCIRDGAFGRHSVSLWNEVPILRLGDMNGYYPGYKGTGCPLAELKIPEGVEYIESGAFAGS